MAQIVIHLPYAWRCLRPMTSIARACHAEGHQTRFWLGALSSSVPNRWWTGSPELAFVWNGMKPRYQTGVRTLRDAGAKIIYVEHGWHPQGPTVQMDPVGINAGAEWAAAPLTSPRETPLAIRDRGDLLLILQHDTDVQISQFSPSFGDMWALVKHVLHNSALPVRVRAHPRHPAPRALRDYVRETGHAWDDSPSLRVALDSCRAVACINSSSAIEALSQGLPVLCFGKAVYRHAGAVYCLSDDPSALRHATLDLLHGKSPLFEECIRDVLANVRAHQYEVDKLAQVLPAMIDKWLRTGPVRLGVLPAAASIVAEPPSSMCRAIVGSSGGY